MMSILCIYKYVWKECMKCARILLCLLWSDGRDDHRVQIACISVYVIGVCVYLVMFLRPMYMCIYSSSSLRAVVFFVLVSSRRRLSGILDEAAPLKQYSNGDVDYKV